MSPLPYELDGHAQADAEHLNLDIEQRFHREVQKIADEVNWQRYKIFEEACIEEMKAAEFVNVYDQPILSGFKEALRTAWEKAHA